MTAVAVDLTPVVGVLIAHPFDRPTLDKAYSAVEGHPHAYATALRCAAKRTEDVLAAAYWLTEAARVHESVDDLGGAIALLSRARDCDPENPRIRELLAASMTRLAVRAGLDFTFSNGSSRAGNALQATDGGAPIRRSGLRPPAPDRHRDTLPDLFGIDGEDSRGSIAPKSVLAVALQTEADANPSPVDEPLEGSPVVFALANPRRVSTLLPPVDPEAAISPVTTVVRAALEDEPMLRAIADIALPTRRSSDLVERLNREGSSTVPTSSPASAAAALPSPLVDDVYGDPSTRPTARPVGDRLVGELFEALHKFHFLDDVREGAAFLSHVLEEKMRPATVLVHVYDINSRHFVVMNASGLRAAALVDYATPEDEPFVVEIMKEDEATLVLQPGDDPRLSRGRWLLAEPRRSVMCAPCAVEDRYLGLVELIDPIDGSEFDENDRNALTYAASAFAKFLDRRGIVLSEDEPSGHGLRASPALAPNPG
jgi:GAF domain-containing protein